MQAGAEKIITRNGESYIAANAPSDAIAAFVAP